VSALPRTESRCIQLKDGLLLAMRRIAHQMEQAHFAGIDYRHVIFTVPEQLRGYIEQCPRLLGELAKAGGRP
jgi:hypothetical protein